VSGIIRRHRAATGSSWRKLNRGLQALLVLAYQRKGETFAELAAGFGWSLHRLAVLNETAGRFLRLGVRGPAPGSTRVRRRDPKSQPRAKLRANDRRHEEAPSHT
jgi:hypothetical protein